MVVIISDTVDRYTVDRYTRFTLSFRSSFEFILITKPKLELLIYYENPYSNYSKFS